MSRIMADDHAVAPSGTESSGPVSEVRSASVSESSAIAQLRAFIADRAYGPGDRLPAEPELCTALGLRRSELRRALASLEREGTLWRHVGKGTFLAEPSATSGSGDFGRLSQQVSPADAMRARSVLEPALAREAALHAPAVAITRLKLTADRMRRATTWREYEALDNEFHRQIAEASGSTTLLALFDQLNTLRRMVSWGRITRTGAQPPAGHSSFAQHDAIAEAIAARDADGAQQAMRAHLRSVEDRLFN
jgi:DNA-binding FadR family transcriptional regulator